MRDEPVLRDRRIAQSKVSIMLANGACREAVPIAHPEFAPADVDARLLDAAHRKPSCGCRSPHDRRRPA
jgi:hypothetical protein